MGRPVAAKYPVTAAFGRKGSWAAGYHPGIDFGCGVGTEVVAPADGTIVSAGWAPWGAAYGYQIVGQSKGTDGRTYRWSTCHHRKGGVSLVRAGQKVKAGQRIGYSGNTGRTTGPHVHFEVRSANRSSRDGAYGYWDHVNPSVILNVKGGGGSSAAAGSTAHSGRYAVTASALNARTGPGTSYAVAATHKKGTIVTTDRKSGDGKWVRSNGSGHWYSLEYLKKAPKSAAKPTKPTRPTETAPTKPTSPAPTPSPSGDKNRTHTARYVVTASVLNARQGPSTSTKVMASHKAGTIVTTDLISGDGNWVRSSGSGHWYYLDYLDPAPKNDDPKASNPVPHAGRYRVTAVRLNARTGPGTDFPVAAVHDEGTIVTTKYKSADGKWLQSSGSGHWYAAEFLVTAPAGEQTVPPPPAPSDPAEPDTDDPETLPAIPDLADLPRSAWTDEPNARADRPLDPALVVAVTVHYPGDGDVSYAHLDREQVAALLRRYRKHHVETNGWADIGYNVAFDQAGRRWDLTGDTIGAHSGTAGNPTSLGALLIVGNDEAPSEAMLAALVQYRLQKRTAFPRLDRWQGHREVPGNSTDCPGDVPFAVVKALRALYDLLSDVRTTPTSPVDPPEEGATALLDLGTLNVIVNRLTAKGVDHTSPSGLRITDVKKGRDYDDRVPGLARVAKAMKADDVLCTQEQGQRRDANALAAAMGSSWSNRLHGDDGDLTQAILRHSSWPEVEGGRFVTEGSHHNTGTWSMVREVTSRVPVMVVTTHTDHRARGEREASEWDLLRERQTKTLIARAEAMRDLLVAKYDLPWMPIVYAGDWNSDKDDDYDGPGHAMYAAGYDDAEVLADSKPNVQWTTLNGLSMVVKAGRRLDRVFVSEDDGVEVLEIRTVWAAPDTDHNGVAVTLRITMKV